MPGRDCRCPQSTAVEPGAGAPAANDSRYTCQDSLGRLVRIWAAREAWRGSRRP